METKSLTKTQKERYWYQQIKEWEQSGISKKAYCRQHNLVYDQFKWWYSKIQEKGIKNETGFLAIEKPARQDTAGKISIVIDCIRIYERLCQEARTGPVIQMDETTVQVLHQEGRSPAHHTCGS